MSCDDKLSGIYNLINNTHQNGSDIDTKQENKIANTTDLLKKKPLI